MQTLTIRIDESYLDQILAFLQQIPKNKREIFQHTKLNISSTKENEDEFLTILANGPTISDNEANEWEQYWGDFLAGEERNASLKPLKTNSNDNT